MVLPSFEFTQKTSTLDEYSLGIYHSLLVIKMMLSLIFLCLLISSGFASSHTISSVRRKILENGVGMTPPMGWNSWTYFEFSISETIIRETADALVSSGLSKLGYQFVNIDDGWAESTFDDKYNLVAKNSTFPSGIKALADYVHSKELKLGILSYPVDCYGTTRGSLPLDEQDANTFASWEKQGIDYLKYSNCEEDPNVSYPLMAEALNKTGREIVFAFGTRRNMPPSPFWATRLRTSWLTAGLAVTTWVDMLSRADRNEASTGVARPGVWKDPDFLAIGYGNMTTDEEIAHFSIWAISKAPLILACDIREISNETMRIITNAEVIAVNQDSLGVQGKKVGRLDMEVWSGPLSGNRTAILLLNRGNQVQNITVYWNDINIPANAFVEARDLWKHETLTNQFLGNLTASVNSHACKMYVLTPKSIMISTAPYPEGNGNKSNVELIVGLVVGTFFLVGVVSSALFIWWKKRNRSKYEEDIVLEMSNNVDYESAKRFTYSELVKATNNFTADRKLGEGGFGGVYRGVLNNSNLEVAVKRISQTSRQGSKEFVSEVKIISKLRHKNLIQLLGWCLKKQELLLVYEFMPNGSLDFHLFKGRSVITWVLRYKIVLNLASALQYLHEEWLQGVVHRDIKTANVMLDSEFNAKLGDFGLARFVDHDSSIKTTMLAGTIGYVAPECMTTGKAGKGADVYSFGVVILEIASGRRVFESESQDSELRRLGLVKWVWEFYESGRLVEAVDMKLGSEYDEEELKRLLVVGLWCANWDYNQRPSIKQVISVLNFEAPLPNLPSQMYLPTHVTSPSYELGFSYESSSNASAAGSNQSHTLYSTSNRNLSNSSASPKHPSTATLLQPVSSDDDLEI